MLKLHCRSRRPNKKRGHSFFLLQNTLSALDLFDKPLPVFNIKGSSSVPSITGALVSSLIYILLALYASYSFIHVITRHSPSISSYMETGVVTNEYELNMRDNGLRIAFTVEGFLDG